MDISVDVLMMRNLYKRIENLCEEKGITVTQLCRDTGISRSTMSELKAGRTINLSSVSLVKFARFFNVSTDYLLGLSK